MLSCLLLSSPSHICCSMSAPLLSAVWNLNEVARSQISAYRMALNCLSGSAILTHAETQTSSSSLTFLATSHFHVSAHKSTNSSVPPPCYSPPTALSTPCYLSATLLPCLYSRSIATKTHHNCCLSSMKIASWTLAPASRSSFHLPHLLLPVQIENHSFMLIGSSRL